MNNPSDHLLYALSAQGTLSWPTFKRIVGEILQDRLQSSGNGAVLRHRILGLLDSFSYCDSSFSARLGSIFVCPAEIVRIPIAGCSAILIGARSPRTVDHLLKIGDEFRTVKITIDSGETFSLLPSRIGFQGDDEGQLKAFAATAKIPFQREPPSWILTHFAGDLTAYLHSLKWAEGSDFNWQKWEFDPEYCQFKSALDPERPLRLIRYLSPVTNTFRYRVWKGKLFAEVDPDWARYAVLQSSGYSVLYYDRNSHYFAVPRTAWLPHLLQRVLGLCSGFEPLSFGASTQEASGKVWDLFQNVPMSIAETVSEKLGQKLSYCSLTGGHKHE